MAKKKVEIELVDVGYEEFTQISKNIIFIEESFFKTSRIGVIQSIFHEFLFKFQTRQNLFSKQLVRLILETTKYKFLIQYQKNSAKVYIDNKHILSIDMDGQVLSPKGKQMFASFKKETADQRVMRFNDQIIAHVGDFDNVSGRYFSYVNKNIKPEQEWMFILLCAWGIFQDPQ